MGYYSVAQPTTPRKQGRPAQAKDFDRLISGYRLSQTVLLGDPCCCSCMLFHRPTNDYQVAVKASQRTALMRRRATVRVLTALHRDTALLRQLCWGNPAAVVGFYSATQLVTTSPDACCGSGSRFLGRTISVWRNFIQPGNCHRIYVETPCAFQNWLVARLSPWDRPSAVSEDRFVCKQKKTKYCRGNEACLCRESGS